MFAHLFQALFSSSRNNNISPQAGVRVSELFTKALTATRD